MTGPLDRIEEVFHAASGLSGPKRSAYLDSVCLGDAGLRAEVEALLRADEGSAVDSALADAAVLASGATADDEPVPERIGPFRIVRVIGEGGMGRVYEAEQASPHRRVALKVIRPGMVSRSALRRFAHEAEVLAGLKHPGIAQIYQSGSVVTAGGIGAGVGLEGGGNGDVQPYFAMELVNGPPLTTYAGRRALAPHDRLALLAKVCDSVQHAHQRGVIHRDLKPGNILVEEGEGGETGGEHATPKILDFGIARLTGDATRAGETLATQVGQILGTPAYMSPEQVEGDPATIDTRSDVYALGVIGYELLAGRPPLDVAGKPITEIARIIREVEPAWLGSLDASLRGDAETIIAKAMEKDRDRRYASAAELGADIRRFLADEPIAARPASTFYQLRKFARRNRGLVGGASVALLALVVGVVGLSVGLVRARIAEHDARETAKREAAQKALAERRFTEVRSLARTLIYDIYDKIALLSGATEAREKIVETARAYTDGLARESEGDAGLQVELAGVYRRIAELLGAPGNPNLGQTERALETAQQSVDLLNRVVQADPVNTEARSNLADSYSILAGLQRISGKMEAALASYTRNAELADQRARELPDDKTALETAALADVNLGRMKEGMGRSAEAIPHYERFKAYCLQRTGPELTDARVAGNAAVMELKIGEALLDLGRLDEAEARLRAGDVFCQQIIDRYPDLAPPRSTLANTNLALSRALVKQQRFDEALVRARRVTELRQQAVDKDPNDRTARRNAAVAHFGVGNVMGSMKRFDEALVEYRAYRDGSLALAALDPAQTSIQHDVALARMKMGGTLTTLGRHAEARAELLAAMEIHQRLLEAEPGGANWITGVLDDLANLAECELAASADAASPVDERRDRVKAARDYIDRGLKMAGELKEQGKLPASSSRKPGEFLELAAKAEEAASALQTAEAITFLSGAGTLEGSSRTCDTMRADSASDCTAH